MFKSANMRKSAKLWLLYVLIILVLNGYLFILAAGLSEGGYMGKNIIGDGDYPTYLAKMKIGYDGSWQYLNRYTTEPHEPSFIFLFYILLGHLAAFFDLNLHFTFHAARFILAFFALKVLYDFIGKYREGQGTMTVFLLAVFLSGTYVTALDYTPQYHIFVGIMGYTHYMLTLICLLNFFAAVLDYEKDRRKTHILKAVVTLNILALVHPFMVVLAGLAVTGKVVLSKTLSRTFPLLAAAALGSAPLMLYYFHVFAANPVLAGWREQAVTPHPVYTPLILFGPASLLTYLTILLWARKKIILNDLNKLFAVWLLIAVALSYTDLITSSIQWLFFASLPASGLAYESVRYIDERSGFAVRCKGRSIAVGLLVILLALPSACMITKVNLLAWHINENRAEYPANIIAPEDMRCFEWLKQNANPNDIIIAAKDTGNLIPFVTNSYTFIGHSHETIDYRNKKKQVDQFLAAMLSEEEARSFLERNKARYVIRNNQGEPGFVPGPGYQFLEPVMTGKTFTLYRYDQPQ